jgi:hypothetical protein
MGEYDHGYLYLPETAPLSAPDVCRPLGRWWVSPAFELAWMPTRPAPAPIRLRVPLGAGTVPGPVLPVAGVVPEQFQGGFGLNAGHWLDDSNTRGIEGSLFVLGGSSSTFDAHAPGMLVLFPNGHNRSAPQLLFLPPGSAISGSFPTTLSTWFIGADANYRQNLYCSLNLRLDALGGYRFAYLQDEFYVGDRQNGSTDHYRQNRVSVSNQFQGGQIGLAGEYRANRWFLDGTVKMAFGAVIPSVSASGLMSGAEGGNGSGGYARLAGLTDPTHAQFAVLPTINLTLGKQIRDHTRVFVGYSFQYLSRVTRIGDALDPGTGASVATTDFWVQAVNFGVELRY